MTVTVENPTKLDDNTVQKLEQSFSLDCTVEEACFYANISRQTYYNWINSFPEWKERFDTLRQKPILLARKTAVDKIGDSYSNAMDYLSRKRKDEFSTKQEIGIYQNDQIEKQLNDAQRTIEQASAIAAELIQGEQPAALVESNPTADRTIDSTPRV